MRSNEEVSIAIEKYANTVKRIAFVNLKNYSDTEDIFQTVFLKYALSSLDFKTSEHEKAWIIKVTINACRDVIKNFFRKNTVSIDDYMNTEASSNGFTAENLDILRSILALPKKYKDVIYLHYYEGYTAPEIGKILNKNTNTVYTLLTRAREQLKTTMEGDDFNG